MERTQERDNSPLSTADVAAAAEGGKPDETGSPKYIEGEETAAAAKAAPAPAESTPLLPEDNLRDLRSRWSDIQASFVDAPRQAVEQADHLVAEVIKRLAEVFAQERSKLEQQWDRGDSVDTEDLRVALQRYRSFFQRLLSA
jgi:hypothetical protein